MLDPFPTLEAIEQHYASRFEEGNYQTLLALSEQYRKVYQDYVSWVTRHLALPGKRSLDIGCFTGELVAALLEAGADAYGLELQRSAVAVAQQRLSGRVFELNIDDNAEPFPEGSLDIVTMMAVIEHVQKPAALLKRVRSLLKDDGWLFLENAQCIVLASTDHEAILAAAVPDRTHPLVLSSWQFVTCSIRQALRSSRSALTSSGYPRRMCTRC